MYKTISVHPDTYQQLHAIAAKLNKPKAQVVNELVQEYAQKMTAAQEKELQKYNDFMAKLIKKVRLPKGTKVDTSDIDRDFEYLADTDYQP